MLGNHLLGLYEKALASGYDWETRLKKAEELGFDYMEISIDETDFRMARLDWSREEIRKLMLASHNSNIPIQSMCLSAHRRFPLGSTHPEIRTRAKEIMTKAIDLACSLGIRVIQLAGYDVYYEPSTPESVRLFRDGIIWAAKQAEKKQVMLAMEIMDTSFINSISKYMSYEGMIRSPWFKVYPDVGNISAWPENDVDYEFSRGIGSIVAIHLKDTLAVRDDFPGKFKCVPFGSGCVDFPRRFAQLENLGYTGPYMIEMWAEEGKDDIEEIRKARAWVEDQFRRGINTT